MLSACLWQAHALQAQLLARLGARRKKQRCRKVLRPYKVPDSEMVTLEASSAEVHVQPQVTSRAKSLDSHIWSKEDGLWSLWTPSL